MIEGVELKKNSSDIREYSIAIRLFQNDLIWLPWFFNFTTRVIDIEFAVEIEVLWNAQLTIFIIFQLHRVFDCMSCI